MLDEGKATSSSVSSVSCTKPGVGTAGSTVTRDAMILARSASCAQSLVDIASAAGQHEHDGRSGAALALTVARLDL